MQETYKRFDDERSANINAILSSAATKKMVVAGPGTGKSFLFKKICIDNHSKGKTKNLTLSFINELISDLANELRNLSDVHTLHGFALSHLPKERRKMYFGLTKVIEEDYEIINGKEINFAELLSNLTDAQDDLAFYSMRRKYYDFFGPHCSIYTLIKIFEENGGSKIPKYSQVLIDEFQDFNKLEAKIIDQLSEKSAILIVGDDDQALYSFKYAGPENIRTRFTANEYEKFELPYCSRCTEVTINAFNNLIDKAKSEGFLQGRIEKHFRYFPTEEKDAISAANPKIIVKKSVYQNKLASEIDYAIQKLFERGDKMDKSILIICPFRSHVKKLTHALKIKGYKNIDYAEKHEEDLLMEGMNLLLDDDTCNLGWRIVSKHILFQNGKVNTFEEILKKSHPPSTTNLADLLES
jgi:hypothetical protein